MKGTLFSSDFIIDESNNLRLLEFNTDSGFVSDTLASRFDFTDFISVLSSNNITKLSILYKSWHREFVDHLNQAIENDATFITEFSRIEEADHTVYPTNVTDEADRFILRICYDENAIFDSTYCKQRIEVLKLFHDNDATGSIPEFRASGSNWEGTSMSSSLNLTANYPDLAVKDLSENHNPLQFAKFNSTLSSESSSADLLEDYWWNYLDRSDQYMEKYHTNPTQVSNGKQQTVREYGILYGSTIEYVRVGSYTIDSLLPVVDISGYDDANKAADTIPNKHYFEYTTNFIRTKNWKDSLLDSEVIVKSDGSFVSVDEAIIGDNVKSYIVSGSPDTDDVDVFGSWSYDGSTLPSGSEVTSSNITSFSSESLVYGTGIELVLPTEETIYFAPYKNILTYNSSSDEFKFKSAHTLLPGDGGDYLIDGAGGLIPISQSNTFILNDANQNEYYQVNVETTDTFFISASTPFVVHNAPCFIAGTKVHIEEKGITNIEDVEVGDKVISYNHDTDTVEYREVLKVREQEGKNVVTYIFENGTTLTATPDHPLFVNGKGYSSYYPKQTKEDSGLDVEQIFLGDEVLHMDGYGVVIDDILEEPVTHTVYNLEEVDGNNNFFVENLLAHNRVLAPQTCFAAGTQISLSNGDVKDIEDIVVGDEVLGWDGDTIDSAEVIAIDHRHTVGSHADACESIGDVPSLYTINDTEIEFTPEHPFLTKEGWKSLVPDPKQEPYLSSGELKILKIGDYINKDGEWIEIEDIRIIRSDAEEPVYNITVDKLHSYIANGIIVHNK